jgi:hypothetical protein
MKQLARYPLIYLATPYTKYEAGIECAFKDAAALVARLLKIGVGVYSPIVHCHPIAIYGGLNPKDHTLWLPFDEIMMSSAHALLVAQMHGWRESYGVKHEIEFFAKAEKPVFYLDTVLLRIATAPFDFDTIEAGGCAPRVQAFTSLQSTVTG